MIRHSLRDKLLLYVISVLILVGLVLIAVVFFFSRDAIINQKKEDLKDLDAAYAEGFRYQFDTAQSETRDLALRRDIIAYGVNPEKVLQDPSIRGILQEENVSNVFSTLSILDARGVMVVSTEPSFLGKDFSFRDYFRKAQQGMTSIEFAIGAISKQPGFYAAAPIRSHSGTVSGMVIAKINPEAISTALTEAAANTGGHIMLVDEAGVILYADQPERIFQTITPLSDETKTRLEKEKGLVDQPFQTIPYESVFQGISTYMGPITVDFFDSLDKENEMVGIVNVQGTSFYLLNEFGLDELLAPINRVVVVIAAIVVLLILLLGGGLILLIRKTLQPLNDFQRIAKRMSQGDFSERAIIHSSDEIEELGIEFNAMARELGLLYRNLDMKVAEQVKDLAKFRMAADSASDHIVITDAEGVVLYANPAAARITGYSHDEILGKKAGGRELWGGMMPLAFYEEMWRTIKIERRVFSGEITNRRKNGDIYQALASISPIVDNGNLLFFLGIERDISRDKEVDRAKTEFVSLASHQLRTPLTAISWYAEILLDGANTNLDPDQREQLDTILRSSHRMTELVDTLLNVSRLEMGTFTIDPATVDVTATVEDILQELTVTIRDKRLEIVENFGPEPVVMTADPKLLRMVLQNILSNAVKYTQSGDNITVTIERQADEYLFSVSDTGFGIPKKDQPLIFNKLFRADNAKQQEVEGTGLGLYITKTIVEKAGGKIWFESEENVGTTFLITFPLIGMQAKEGTKSLVE